ncbi:ATP-binding protein [Streptomyces verrucosisporus]|uniref:ATP-binding protein n=1 Tax=Streptomyces verrucosisporus TaxID=1695161 RepID=UPI0019D147BC|nr:ATP-binding protein [Streptomyces verrucosisporus]MBN3928196.1 ATP-binding protein [Streptomyces verrucosisporus]
MATPHHVSFRLSRRRGSVPRARALLGAVLGEWRVGQDVLETAELVLSELVTNAVRVRVPNDRQVGVRIAHSRADGLLRLEVSDAGDGWPRVRDPGEDDTGGRGLLLVEALAHRWGVRRRACGIGKTVWAELKAPDLVAVPVEREIAAVTAQPGQRVRLWGVWKTIRSVRGERSPLGGLVMVLGLDDGPAMRVDAAEPLVVMDGGADVTAGTAVTADADRPADGNEADRAVSGRTGEGPEHYTGRRTGTQPQGDTGP